MNHQQRRKNRAKKYLFHDKPNVSIDRILLVLQYPIDLKKWTIFLHHLYGTFCPVSHAQTLLECNQLRIHLFISNKQTRFSNGTVTHHHYFDVHRLFVICHCETFLKLGTKKK
eukprot:724474_1